MRKLIIDNAPEVIRILLKELNIKYTEVTIKGLKENPYFPDLISISYTLSKLGVENIALKSDFNQLMTFPSPFIVHMKDNNGMFLVVKEVGEQQVTFISENNKTERQPKDDFLKTWSGNVLLMNNEKDKVKEQDYQTNFIKQTLKNFRIPFLMLISISLIFYFIIESNNDLWERVYKAFSLSGLITSILLTIQFIDENNHLIKNICKNKQNKKINCSSILNSKASKIFDLISWSEIGLIYFSSQLLILIFFQYQEVMFVLGILSLLAFPYIFYSVIYQWKIAKVWCRLCLIIQIVFFVQALISVIFFYKSNLVLKVSFTNLFLILSIPITLLVLTSFILPILKEFNSKGKQLITAKSIKMQPLVFQMQLANTRKIEFDSKSDNLLQYGKSESNNHILVVINPTCSPCIANHKKLCEITSYNEEIMVSEVFLVEKDDLESYKIAIKMIDMYMSESEAYFKIAISDYYNNYVNRSDKWIKKYWKPDFETEQSKAILEKHMKWCLNKGINSTPKIIYNGKLLPEEYDISDIEYLVY